MDPDSIKMLMFVVFPGMNLLAILQWRRYMYERKARGRSEKERKRSNAMWLIVSLAIVNSMFLYLILRLIHG